VSGSGISWDICKSAPRSRQTTTPDRPDALPAAQQQRQSTEGSNFLNIIDYLNTYLSVYLFICFCMLAVVLSSHIAATTAELLVIW